MVAYNFHPRFAPAVEALEKRQTMRALRKHPSRHARPGERLQLLTGARTKACRKLVTPDPVCTLSAPVFLEQARAEIDHDGRVEALRSAAELDALARRDGFGDWDELADWFETVHGLPFRGWLIGWAPAGEGGA